jgi:hypothetical protein
LHGLAVDSGGRPQSPAELAASPARYFVGARLKRLAPLGAAEGADPLELTVWLMDRAEKRVTSRTVTLDLPLLIAPRNALADLMAETARAPSELERADMTWYEDLDEERLALAGELVRALRRTDGLASDETDALVARADRLAPHSFVVATAVAEHLLPRDSGCTRRTVDRLSHLLSLHREVPFTLETYVLSCALASDFDPAAPEIPAWSKRSGSHCRVGAKGLTSVASSRIAGGGPAAGWGRFITGLGGLYLGDTCDAGYAVMQHSDEALGPPLVRASLELEAAVYFYGARDPDKSRRWFARALATASSVDDPPCALQLLGAEAELGLADLAVEEGREAEARAHLEPARGVAERCRDWRMRGRILNSEALL